MSVTCLLGLFVYLEILNCTMMHCWADLMPLDHLPPNRKGAGIEQLSCKSHPAAMPSQSDRCCCRQTQMGLFSELPTATTLRLFRVSHSLAHPKLHLPLSWMEQLTVFPLIYFLSASSLQSGTFITSTCKVIKNKNICTLLQNLNKSYWKLWWRILTTIFEVPGLQFAYTVVCMWA